MDVEHLNEQKSNPVTFGDMKKAIRRWDGA